MTEQNKSNSKNATSISFYLAKWEIRVFKNSLIQMGGPHYVRFLFNPDENTMIMEPYPEKTFISFRIRKEMLIPGRTEHLRIYSKALTTAVAKHMGWDVSKSYRIPGYTFQNQGIAKFNLTDATEIRTNI